MSAPKTGKKIILSFLKVDSNCWKMVKKEFRKPKIAATNNEHLSALRA
jgi:hypothetical protein